MLWLYDIPDWLLALLIVALALALSLAGFRSTRSLRARPANDVAGAVLGTVGLVQGVLLALVAVAAWNNYTAAGDAAEREAAAVSNMFRQFEGYPDPARQQLEMLLRNYVELVVNDEWPALERAKASARTLQARDALARALVSFEPRNAREQLLHESTARDLEEFLDARRARLVAAGTGLPAPLWVVSLLGSVLTIFCTYFFRMDDQRALLLMTSTVAVSLGLLIYLILVLDHPVWGAQGIQPDAFVNVLSSIAER